jgi:tetratricopeptide (TPR) repeat protein
LGEIFTDRLRFRSLIYLSASFGALFLIGLTYSVEENSFSFSISFITSAYAIALPEPLTIDVSNATLASHFIKGNELFNNGDYEGALAQYNAILQLDPQNANASYDKGNVLVIMNDYSKAVNSYSEALAIDYTMDSAAYNKGIALMKLGNSSDAIKSYEEALNINPNNTKALNNVGVVYGNSHDYDEAVNWYDKALQINPNYILAMSNKGIALMKLGKYEDALNTYDRLLEQTSDSEDINIIPNKALVLGVYLRNYDAALNLVDQYLSNYPTDRDLLCSTIEIYKAAGYEEVAKNYQDTLKATNAPYNCNFLTTQRSDIWADIFV